ncbi:MAG: hypothetical protein AAFY76_17375, partial [Cyanobacteria bacterium J06649_11]
QGWALGTSSKGLLNSLGDDVSIVIAKGGDDLAYLDYMGAEAVYITGQGSKATIMVREGAPRSALIEEALHHTQRVKHGEEYFLANRSAFEVEAQDMLIDLAKKENWGASEVSRLEAAKESWIKLLNEGK